MGSIEDLINKFKTLHEEMQKISGETIAILPDKNGMIDRQCPKPRCNSFFKVNSEDWKNIVKNEEVFCLFCKNNSPANDYLPTEQRDAIINSLRKSIRNHWDFGGSIVQNISLESREGSELHIQCEKCAVRFSVVGAAYFCPCCGHSSIEKIAKELISKLIQRATAISSIQKSLEQSLTIDEATLVVKSIIENSLSDCIGSLQAFSESKYKFLTNIDPPFNAFQNVDKANGLWMALRGQGYESWLAENEIYELVLFTQQRHIIEHKGGIVDLKYIENTGDKNYIEGQRIIVSPGDIIKLGNIALKIIDSINNL